MHNCFRFLLYFGLLAIFACGSMADTLRKLNDSELKILANVQLPPTFSYARYVTFVRSQGGGGCGTMSSLAILDIFKERDCPYSPDFSYRFAEYVYNNSNGHMNQLDVLQNVGCCSEASLHSDYYVTPQPLPTQEHYTEASAYRIIGYSDRLEGVTVDQLKRILVQYGPIFTSGDTPNSPPHQHIFTIIGYNDNTKAFTVLNSYGDRWGNNGMMDMPYSNISNPPNNQSAPRVDWIRYVINKPSKPIMHPYTARLNLHHNTARSHFIVQIGVEGETPMTVWNHPNTTVDQSKNLVLDVPLPAYAAKHWPPNERNRWYVQVTDDSPTRTTETVGMVNDAVLVQRKIGRDGRVTPVLYRSSMHSFAVPKGAGVQVYIPTRRQSLLDLTTDRRTITAGQTVVFSGNYRMRLDFAANLFNVIPQPNREVKLYQVINDPIEGTILKKVVATATTNANGQFSISYTPTVTASYQAVVTKPDGTTVEATSPVREVTISP